MQNDHQLTNAKIKHINPPLINKNKFSLYQDKNTLITDISKVFNCLPENISEVKRIKAGMTNSSYTFTIDNTKYVIRLNGIGTEKLINRHNEAETYKLLKQHKISDDIVYLDENQGYKITRFVDNAHNCNPYNLSDVKRCIDKLKQFHQLNLQTNNVFDIFDHIDFYESLWNGMPSVYSDYFDVKKAVFKLKEFIDKQNKAFTLCHIDAVPDNFLVTDNDVIIIDWEYAGMGDPHLDLAMFSVYSFYDKKQIDELINIYFAGNCNAVTRLKIYCYVSTAGLLWSNWCEYKHQKGAQFGEYAYRQYAYAKEYSSLVLNLIQ